jgi:hypothetical protein
MYIHFSYNLIKIETVINGHHYHVYGLRNVRNLLLNIANNSEHLPDNTFISCFKLPDKRTVLVGTSFN